MLRHSFIRHQCIKVFNWNPFPIRFSTPGPDLCLRLFEDKRRRRRPCPSSGDPKGTGAPMLEELKISRTSSRFWSSLILYKRLSLAWFFSGSRRGGGGAWSVEVQGVGGAVPKQKSLQKDLKLWWFLMVFPSFSVLDFCDLRSSLRISGHSKEIGVPYFRPACSKKRL